MRVIMFHINTSRIVLLATVFCIAFSFLGLAFAGDNVPLKGSFSGVGADFSGNFTHLGLFDGFIEGFAATWSAANGDEVNANTVSFVVDPTNACPDGFVGYIQQLVIDGGTGRFENAVGGATVTGCINFGTGEYDGYLDGTISRPNS